MNEKELLYVEDALNHIKLIKTKCANYTNQLQDRELQKFVKELETKNDALFNQFLQLL